MAEIEFNFRRRAKFISNIYINKRYEISGVLGWEEIVPFERGLCRMNNSKIEWTYQLYKMSISTWLSLLKQALIEDM